MPKPDLSSAGDFDLVQVRQRMKETRTTQAQLAQALGVNQSAISNILKGLRQVKVHEASIMRRTLGMNPVATVAFVPVIGITSAGQFREAILLSGKRVPIPLGMAGERAFAVECSGDSMDEIIADGAYVVVDPDQTGLFNDKVYLIENAEHETQIKLYRSNPARFEPRSSNELHQPIFMGAEPVRVIGRVVFQGQTL